MKKMAQTLLVCSVLFAVPAFGGIRYEFQEVTRGSNATKNTNLVAKAVIDGEMSRLDVVSGNLYRPGNYIISHGDNRIYVVQPLEKSYTEYQTGDNSIPPGKVKITNPVVEFREIQDPSKAVIAGFRTKHFRLTLRYDITVQVGMLPITQRVHSTIDKWMTNAFDHVIGSYQDNIEDLKTGNPAIDLLIETEASKFSGLALRQQTVIVTTSVTKRKSSARNMPTSRKRTTEMVVMAIEEVDVSPNQFAIPLDYTRSDSPLPPSSSTHYLNMKPDGQ